MAHVGANGQSGPGARLGLAAPRQIILAELSADPTISAQELRDRLEAEYDIDISRVTVSETIREMREAGVFREAIIPHETYFLFSLFEFHLFPPNFEDNWRETLEALRGDEHTLMFFQADGRYHWRTIMVFRDREQESKWIHEFYKTHGDLVANVQTTVVTNMLKFNTDPEVFRSVIDD